MRELSPRAACRQRPGAGNSLGLVKFELPNPFNVYLHDTPNDALFLRPRRTFSHGCVRLQKPEALARWVLDGLSGWSPARITAAMHAGRESTVSLPEPIPVSIGYFTVWVDADGRVRRLRVVTPVTTNGVRGTSTTTITYLAYNVPVTITAPPAAQVYEPS